MSNAVLLAQLKRQNVANYCNWHSVNETCESTDLLNVDADLLGFS